MFRTGRKIRFTIWALAVAVALGCRAFSSGWAIAICLACLLVIFALLCTTPGDAIRLPRWISEALILLSTFLPGLPLERHALWIHLAILLVLLALLRLANKSPWWAVLYGWFPVC
jgi:hypothetical protein